MAAPDGLYQLVERFDENREAYRSGRYNETQVRREFIDPLFELLGWDIDNWGGAPEAYKDVVHEDAIKVGGAHKAPDYGFRVGGARKFFVEAKKPSVNLRDDIGPAFQLRRYAWSAKLPVSILTDFEELAVYDCRVTPAKEDTAATARLQFHRFDQYPEKWDEIASVFSKEAVLDGSLDAYAEKAKGKRGTATVDAVFLREIESWRETLARDLARQNPDLTRRELNHAVQMTIDRIIFLRMAEDRGLETYGRLQALLNGEHAYARLRDLYRQADERYNSGLFHFRPEQGRTDDYDTLTPKLTVSDNALKSIIKGLYYPDSPYEFSVFPIEVLGQVYEQFLGKVIDISPDRKVTIEEKPEVRKAGGVYYTPKYIVDYIVEQTVGKLVEGKRPGARGGVSKLRIVDPACGSGSFLIGAYEYLLDWHRDQYLADGPEKHRKELYQGHGGEWHLTTAEKKRILLNNIYGVDIDPQAVEVTKLSLLLKVLEGESSGSLVTQLSMIHERALPDLSDNIKCGNSLIGPDFYDTGQLTFLDAEEHYRINVFDWKAAFPDVFAGDDPGFDAVVGNPPYIFTRNQGIDRLEKEYYYRKYSHQSSQLNTFGIFVERCYGLLRDTAVLGFITPNNWLTIDTFSPLRRFVLEQAQGVKIVNILDRVFAANVDCAIVRLERGIPDHLTIGEMKSGDEAFIAEVDRISIKEPSYIIQISLLKDLQGQEVIARIASRSQPLSSYCKVSTGLKVYQVGKGKPPQTTREKDSRAFHSQVKEDDTYGKYLDGVDVRRYGLIWSGEYLSYGDWIAEPRRSVPFAGPRILVRQIPGKPPYMVHAVFTDEPFYNDINSMVAFEPISGISLKYLLALVNSKLLSYWFLKTFDKLQRKIFPQFKVKELATFPIRRIDPALPADVDCHNLLVRLSDQVQVLTDQTARARIGQDKSMAQRQVDAANRQIDQLVYELYGLTDEQIAVVEKAVS